MKKKPDFLKEKKERITYALLYFFITSFLFKTVLGVITGSKCLLVSGIFAIFGILIAIATLMRIGITHSSRRLSPYFNRGKLEFMILLAISSVIALSTSALLFSLGHMIFFHTLYPPEFLAAWVAAIAATISLVFMVRIKAEITNIQEEDESKDIIFILDTDFLLSVLTILTVVISRMGSYIVDYGCAIFAAFFIIAYSVLFLYKAFIGLMDASCDKKTVSEVESCIRKAQIGEASLKALRVNKIGHIYEIIADLSTAKDIPMVDVFAIAENIKRAVKVKFLSPHEVFIGIRLEEKI
ncbi:MAG: hypothetical protein HQL24_02890 [Candidatus Omnitrophica bacterium]|nr:hypothetical protein [Candidatus Omnitrophota bacterium]